MLKVGQLEEHLAKRKESAITAPLGEFKISDDAAELTVTNGSTKTFGLDATATTALSKYLKVPSAYVNKLTPEFKATLLRYEFERKKDVATTVEVLNDEIVAIHQDGQIMLPLTKVAGVITKVFSPQDTIRRMISDHQRFHVDVTSGTHTYEFPTVVEGAEVGDITEAGVRFLAHPFQSQSPSVGTYAERLVCRNGQTTPERRGRISIKGRTVDEVLISMEEAANTVLGQLDDYLDILASTRAMPVPGTPAAFAAQLVREAKLGRQVLDAVLDILSSLPEPISVWDVNQAFTTVANQSENYSVLTRLQTIGGSLAFEPEQMIKRCTGCERLL